MKRNRTWECLGYGVRVVHAENVVRDSRTTEYGPGEFVRVRDSRASARVIIEHGDDMEYRNELAYEPTFGWIWES